MDLILVHLKFHYCQEHNKVNVGTCKLKYIRSWMQIPDILLFFINSSIFATIIELWEVVFL